MGWTDTDGDGIQEIIDPSPYGNEDVNAAPVVDNAIDDIELLVGGDSFFQDLNAVFHDEDGDSLSFSTSSSEETIVSATVSGSILTITAVAVGTATITVTADDGRGGSTQTSFDVTVTSNAAPIVITAIDDIELIVGSDNFTRDLSTVFSDPDGDALNFSASSSNEAVVTAVVSDSILTAAAITVGGATITATADDGRGGTATASFRVSVPTGVAVERVGDELPKEFALGQNYPNPFNPVTTITFDLPKSSYVTLTVYNLMGQEVATLVSADQPAGRYTTTWDATGFASGVYVYRLQAGAYSEARSLLLLK